MKKIYLFVFMLACFQFSKATNPVPNSGFENWTSGYPDNWSISVIPGQTDTTITRVSPGHSGSYAAKGEGDVDNYYEDTVPPQLSSTFPVTLAYNNMQFYYKSNLVGGDKIYFSVYIKQTDLNWVALAVDSISANATSFTLESVNLTYLGGDPASAVIEFHIGNDNHNGVFLNPASYFIIDDVSLNGPVGVEEITADHNLSVFPIPAHDWLTVKGKADNKPTQFLLIDETGRTVLQEKSETPFNNFIDARFNLQGIASGFYSLMMITDEKVRSQRIVVQ